MWNYFWPVLLAVASNVVYHITAKETPQAVNAFLSLTVTYVIAAVLTFVFYLVSTSGQYDILRDFKSLNWTSYILGLVVIGLEAGNIFLYRAGWKIGVGSLVCNITVATILLAVGLLFYKDVLRLKQVVGIVLCVAGLIFINI